MTPTPFSLLSRRLGVGGPATAAVLGASRQDLAAWKSGQGADAAPVLAHLARWAIELPAIVREAHDRDLRRWLERHGLSGAVPLAVATDHATARALGWPTAGMMQMAVAELAARLILDGRPVETIAPDMPSTERPDDPSAGRPLRFHLLGQHPPT